MSNFCTYLCLWKCKGNGKQEKSRGPEVKLQICVHVRAYPSHSVASFDILAAPAFDISCGWRHVEAVSEEKIWNSSNFLKNSIGKSAGKIPNSAFRLLFWGKNLGEHLLGEKCWKNVLRCLAIYWVTLSLNEEVRNILYFFHFSWC